MESANKYEVQKGTDRLANINADKVLKIEELRAANDLNLEGMKDFVKNNRKEAPKSPDANASMDTLQQYQSDLGAYNEMKTVLDRFDAQISALKTNYETSKEGLKDATKEELAKLEATVGIEQKPVAPVAKEEPKAPAGKPEAGKDGKAADAPKADSKPTSEAVAKPEAKEAPKTAEYVVKKGDNLTKIAKEHGTTVDALVKENGVKDKDHILVGQKLKVPAKAEKTATDTEAAAANKPAAKPEAGKDGKPEEGKTEKKADAKAETPPKPEAKAGEVPQATATLSDKAKIEAAAKPAPAAAASADVQAPAGKSQTGALGGTK
ncbi:MAG: LysM peptidoglycan-binding domain-containing protein [Patescibacteria group bacterium]